MPTIRAALLLAAAGACAGHLHAQTIWRCGDTYSQQPCAGGRPVADAPGPARDDRTQAGAAAARDARLADAMEKDRLRLEAQAPQAYIPPAKAQPAPEKHKSPEQAATRKLDLFTASVPGSRPAKAKGKAKADDKKAAKKDGKGTPAKPPGPAAGSPVRSS